MKLKNLDIFSSVKVTTKNITVFGSLLSLICIVLISVLTYREFKVYKEIKLNSSLYLEGTGVWENQVELSFDIFFPYLKCEQINFILFKTVSSEKYEKKTPEKEGCNV